MFAGWRGLLAGAFVALVAGCTVETDAPAGGTTAGGETEAPKADRLRIQIDGSSTVKVITQAVSESFQSKFSDVQIALKVTGTGTGFKEMIAGRIDIANASRAVKATEKADCEKNKIDLVELKVALDGLAVCVNKENTWADAITVAQLKKIWEPGSQVKTWQDIDPSWPAEPLTLFGPGDESGTFDYFTEAINGKEDIIRDDYSPSADDNVTITGIAGEKGAMGFFGCAYYFSNKDKVKALKISPTENAADAVELTPEAVTSGAYKPLSRPLFIYVKKSSLERQEVQDFVRFYLNDGISKVSEVGYVPLSEADLKTSRDAFEAALKK